MIGIGTAITIQPFSGLSQIIAAVRPAVQQLEAGSTPADITNFATLTDVNNYTPVADRAVFQANGVDATEFGVDDVVTLLVTAPDSPDFRFVIDNAVGRNAVLSSLIATAASASTVQVDYTGGQVGATFHLYVSDSSTAPSRADLIAGTGAVASASQVISGPNSLSVPGLAAETSYFVFALVEDGAEFSEVLSATVTTPVALDTTAPILTNSAATVIDGTSAALEVDTDEGNGVLYVVASTQGLPSEQQIIDGENVDGSPAPYSSGAPVSAVGTQSLTATDLSDATHTAYFIHEDAAGNRSNVEQVAFTPEAVAAPAEHRFNIPDAGGTSTPELTTTGSVRWRAFEGDTLAETYLAGDVSHTFPSGSGNYWLLDFPDDDAGLVTFIRFGSDIVNGTFPLLDTSSVTSMDFAWSFSQFTGTFPLLDTSSVTSMNGAWRNSQFTGTFPLLDTSSVTNMYRAWSGSQFTGTFPLLDTSSVTNMDSAWSFSQFTGTFPLLDTSSVTNMNGAWGGSQFTGTFPLLDTSSVTSMDFAWSSSQFTGTFPLLDTSSVTSMDGTWRNSQFTGTFPLLDTSSVTSMDRAWSGSQFTTFPAGLLSSCPATNFTSTFVDGQIDQAGIDNIVSDLVAAGNLNGTLNMQGGTNSAPSAAGLADISTLQGRGWTVTYNT